jgi:hypothetical protein
MKGPATKKNTSGVGPRQPPVITPLYLIICRKNTLKQPIIMAKLKHIPFHLPAKHNSHRTLQ